MEAEYFSSQAEFRKWLVHHHAAATGHWVGFYKTSTKRKGISYKEAVDEALCFGWIDAVRKSVDEDRYRIRFTPRRSRSIWSQVNLNRFEELRALGKVEPSGLAAFEGRDPKMAKKYSFENEELNFDEATEAQFRSNKDAWSFWERQPRSYQRTAKWWALSAKREETRAKRVAALIADSAEGKRLAHLVSPVPKWKSGLE
jgi:uncharacterized protein YdeI (YjbR/CyaY-like superfamily)